MVNTAFINSLKDSINGMIVHGFLMGGVLFMIASLIVFVIRERENRAKYHQILAGSNLFSYWLSNFIVDYLKYWIPMGFIFGSLYFFNFNFYTKEDRGLMCACLFIIYGFNLILMGYLFSFLFRSVGKGQVMVFIFTYFCSLFLPNLCFILRLIPETKDFSLNYLEYFLRLLPPFSFGFATLNMPFFIVY